MKEKVNGIEFYYHKLGKGAPLLLLHGHQLDGGMFDKIVAINFFFHKNLSY